MARIKIYGDRATVTGDRQVPTVPSTKSASPPINTDRWARNGRHPDASVFNEMNHQMNQAVLFRTREAFSIGGDLGSAPGIQATSTAGTRTRWRGAFRTMPFHHALLVRAVMFPPSSNYGNDTYATIRIYSDATETTLVSTTELHFGPGPAGAVSVGGWQYHRIIDSFIEGLTADTEYFILVSDVDYGRIQSMAVADLQSATQGNDGYLPTNFTEQSQLLDEYRANLVELIEPLEKKGGAKVLQWTANIQGTPRTTTSASAINVIDNTSTTYAAATPGYTLDMRGKARLSQQTSGIPIVFKAFVSCTSASNGVVHLRDSSGTIIATCTNAYGAGVTGWLSATGVLPATNDQKVYVTYQTAAGTLSCYAYVVYEYET